MLRIVVRLGDILESLLLDRLSLELCVNKDVSHMPSLVGLSSTPDWPWMKIEVWRAT